MNPTASSSGLDGVVAADTALSHVDGALGRLVISGHDVETLTETARFEDVAAALWRAAGLAVDPAALGAGRVEAAERLRRLGDALDAADGMDALRANVAHVAPTSELAIDAARVTGAVAVIGPMRMQYAHVAAQTAYVADRVGEMLTRIMREE